MNVFLLMLGQILAIRAQVEELVIDEESLAYIGEIGQQASLRFAKYVIYKRSYLYNKGDGFFES